ncbi:DUF2267 domain-containing protein [Pyxidicoccus fallax]|uniref:DUF2267 domain-containing protein n=1 Tax=Pyxidicoccus fallax TaxID=394095 RepID=A0A848LLL4_9BACT|nr:DUF2267 domain-containing protein [Pyxidicoccus fallax]NMO18589.1 DUF2267 domain-containing protein [Pyxidicoccus fallax]NPC82504.1 DUF2267 domain-containing protein [Pyxidicoccus fallax]
MADDREQQGKGAPPEEERPASRRDVPIEVRRAQRAESRASQTYKAFLNRLCERGGMSPAVAEQAAVSVLCALEQRIYSEEALDLEAQLPRKLTELLHRCERHEEELPPKFGREELLKRVGEDLSLNPDAVEPVVRAVLDSIRHLISEGEAEDVMGQLPADMRDLWGRAI